MPELLFESLRHITTADLSKQITDLQKQISELQEQLKKIIIERLIQIEALFYFLFLCITQFTISSRERFSCSSFLFMMQIPQAIDTIISGTQ